MDHSTTLARPLPPDLHAPALRILRRLLAGIERPPGLRLGDAILHELEAHPEYTLVIRDPGLLRRLYEVFYRDHQEYQAADAAATNFRPVFAWDGGLRQPPPGWTPQRLAPTSISWRGRA